MNSIENPATYVLPNSGYIRDGYLGPIIDTVYNETLKYQWEILNDSYDNTVKSHCIENFRIAAGESDGEFYGMVFQDSDLAKWLEAISYKLMVKKDSFLESCADDTILLMSKAQLKDGYLDSYFINTDINKRWGNLRDCHELYCAGHLLEAAIAYYQATGKNRILDVVIAYVDYIYSYFTTTNLTGYPGHAEIELALCKLYDLTKNKKYLDLAKSFLSRRGKDPYYFEEEQKNIFPEFFNNTQYGRSYAQSHLPVEEQNTMEGHSVRGLYLACGMADVALRTSNTDLWDACKKLFSNITEKRMYITGGVGSTYFGEAFTFDYDLPTDTAYTETCASIALIFFCRRMLQGDLNGKYSDVMESALYNTCLASISMDGKHFFYSNPLDVYPEASEKDPNKKHISPERQAWMGCACCPPNIARFLCSLTEYQYTVNGNEIQIHLYLAGKTRFNIDDQDIDIAIDTQYPRNGQININTSTGNYDIQLHIPSWCSEYTIVKNGITIDGVNNNGYVMVQGPFANDKITLNLKMTPVFIRANGKVRDTAGKVSLKVGPVVYAAEERDNGANLQSLCIDTKVPAKIQFDENLLNGTQILTAHGYREVIHTEALYTELRPEYVPCTITLIPYHKWANRGKNEMTVWIREMR